ncbi:efflux RND transporter permease subunit, partial [Fangia hongkongensis]
MKLSEICIKNPVFSVVLSILILIVGFIGYSRLQVTGYPNITNSEIGIHTTLSGASSSYMQQSVSDVIENAVSSITGVEDIESNSQDGVSDVIVRFSAGVNVDEKLNQITNAVAKVASLLPEGVEGPDINQANPNSTPIIDLFFSSKKMKTTELTDYINRYILPNFKKIQGVAEVQLFGDEPYALRIWLQPQKMATLHVTAEDVLNAIATQNILSASGEIKTPSRDYALVPNAKIEDLDGFKRIVVTHYQGKNILLQDVAKIELGENQTSTASFLNNKQGVGIGIVPTDNANPLTVAKAVYHNLDQIKESLPDDIHYKVGFDLTSFLKASIDTTYETFVIAIILVVLVIIVFIGSIRASLIPIATLPICLIGSFIFLYWMGFSLNVLTLLSLVLAVGLIVDDAIVVVENIHRHIQLGLTPLEAAIKGMREIGFAILVITLTLAAVFAPIGFSQGLTGQLFWQFAFTMVVAVLLSGFIAVTLSPMMCAYLLKKDKTQGYSARLNIWVDKLSHFVAEVVNHILRYRVITLISFAVFILCGGLIYNMLPKMLAPQSDQGNITIPLQASPNASFSYMKEHALLVSHILSEQEEGVNTIINLGQPNTYQGNANLILKPWDKRDKTQSEIEAELQKKLANIPGIIASPAPAPPLGIGGQGGFSIEFILSTQNSFEYLYHVAQRIISAMQKNPNFIDIGTNIQFNESEYQANINRSLAADVGVNVEDISNTLAVFMGDYIAGKYYYDNYPYNIIVSSHPSNKNSLNALQSIYVPTSSGGMVPISSFISTKIKTIPTVLTNYNKEHALHIMANLKGDYSTGLAIDDIQQILKADLPNDVGYTW